MSARDAITRAELEALHELGYEWLNEDSSINNIVEAYRAGFRDGSTSPEPRVFRAGDPDPGPETTAVMDRDHEVWRRFGDEWGFTLGDTDWYRVLSFGPLLDCSALPDYRAAVEADDQRRAGLESAGGDR